MNAFVCVRAPLCMYCKVKRIQWERCSEMMSSFHIDIQSSSTIEAFILQPLQVFACVSRVTWCLLRVCVYLCLLTVGCYSFWMSLFLCTFASIHLLFRFFFFSNFFFYIIFSFSFCFLYSLPLTVYTRLFVRLSPTVFRLLSLSFIPCACVCMYMCKKNLV